MPFAAPSHRKSSADSKETPDTSSRTAVPDARSQAHALHSFETVRSQRRRAPSSSPLATTRDGRTTLSSRVHTRLDRDVILAHEAAHRSQFRADAPPGSRQQLEHDADHGAARILAGLPHRPRVSAPRGMVLAYGPEQWFPDLQSQSDREVQGLQRVGLTHPESSSRLSFGASQDADGGARASYDISVAASGDGGQILSDSHVVLDHQPDRRVGVVGPPTVQLNPEYGLGPVDDRPAYPYTLRYSRTVSYTDANGRSVTVEIDGRVFFSDRTMAAQLGALGGEEPSFEALLNLRGDSGYVTASIQGSGPVTGYFAQYAAAGESLSLQARGAAANLGRSGGLSFLGSAESAAFLDPRLSAGDQYDSLRRYLLSADAAWLAQQRDRADADARPGWLDGLTASLARLLGGVLTPFIELEDAATDAISGWWNELPPWARGVMTSVAKFGAALLVMAAAAGLIVLAAKGAIAFGAAMLVVGAVALAAGYVMSFGSRLVEAWRSDNRWRLMLVPMVAALDTLGISGIIEGSRNESLLTGAPLGLSEEGQWEVGTTGVLQLVGIILMVRGMRGSPGGRSVAPEVRGNLADFHALPAERLPVLPEGHYWVRQGPEWSVFREPTAPEVPLEISIFSDGQGKINFNVRSGDRVLQSEAMTRPPNDTYQGGENRLPPELRGVGDQNPYLEDGTGRLFEKGHGIDYVDRLEGPGVRSSNADVSNFTPQARFWNSFLRNHLVRAIRSRGGGYRELPLYEGTPSQTANQTPIPRAFIFVETNAAGEPVAAWRIPNDPALNTRTQSQLPQYSIPLSEIPGVMLRPDGAVKPPGTFMGPAGAFITGERGEHETQ